MKLPPNEPHISFARIADDERMLGGEGLEGKLTHYFAVGFSAMRIIAAALQEAEIQPRRILDMPCGHGRVLRFLTACFPWAEHYACDLLRGGVDYCAQTFGAVGVYSHRDFGEVSFSAGVSFDLIWSGSLITHLSEQRTKDFLRLCARNLSHGGIAVVSSHGEHCFMKNAERLARQRAELRRAGAGIPPVMARKEACLTGYLEQGYGYWFSNDEDYGGSLIHLGWFPRAAPEVGLQVVATAERAWDQNHDVIVFRRRAAV